MLKPFARTMLLSALTVSTLLYLNTAMITGGGGFMIRFAAKPFHGIYPFYRPLSGEERAWRALAESSNPPWWITGDYVLLLTDSSEGETPLWVIFYKCGYYATWIGWFYMLLTLMSSLVNQSSRHDLT